MNEPIRIHEPIVAKSVSLKRDTTQHLQSKEMLIHIGDDNGTTVNTILH